MGKKLFLYYNRMPNKNKKQIFDQTHYQSGDGMLTSVWGPSLWHFLHTLSFNYPIRPTNKQKEYHYDFMTNLQNILPCSHCRNNLTSNLKKANFTRAVLKNRMTFSKFMYNLHQEVNCMLGKKCNLTYEQIRFRYEHFRSRCLDKKKKTVKTSKFEDGCTDPLYGRKSKCILRVVPKNSRERTFNMSPKCKIRRLSPSKSIKKSTTKKKKRRPLYNPKI